MALYVHLANKYKSATLEELMMMTPPLSCFHVADRIEIYGTSTTQPQSYLYSSRSLNRTP